MLVHTSEISYSRISHPDEVFTIGEKHDLKVISKDEQKMQMSCSIKALTPDPFENISNYEIGKTYKAKTALQAAKKGYRDNKNIEKIYVYDSKAKTVHGFDTSSFFTVKKPQKKK